MIHEQGDIVMVEIDYDYEEFSLFKNELHYTYGKNSEHTESGLIELPPGSYTIVGLSSKLSEDEWRGIVECMDKHFGYYRYYNNDVVDGEKCTIRSATESGLSLLKSKNLSPDTTLILKKQNSKV